MFSLDVRSYSFDLIMFEEERNKGYGWIELKNEEGTSYSWHWKFFWDVRN